MKILIADNIDETGIQRLREEPACEVDIRTDLTPERLQQIIGNYHAVIIRSATKLTAEILAAGAPRLRAVARADIGLDNVDIPAATEHGIVVMNTPQGNTVTTAEHTISMMLALTRNIPQGTRTLKSGVWAKKQLQGREIFNKTLGVIGFGKIGAIVADRARQFRMNVIVADPNIPPEVVENEGHQPVTFEELLQRSDFITVHVPKMKETTGLLNKDAFAQMKKEAMVINCARGGIIDEADLYEALVSGRIAGAALDVFETEPPGDSPLFTLDNVIATPHLGAATKEAQVNVSEAAASQIIAYLKNDTIINSVNAPAVSGEELAILQPLITLSDRMGELLAKFSEGHLRALEIEYTGDFQGLNLEPVTTAAVKGLLAPIVQHTINSINAMPVAAQKGIKITTRSGESPTDYLNLITLTVTTQIGKNTVAGTIFGKNAPRIIRINDFRLEMIPTPGNFAIIHNLDRPGAIGSIGMTLGEHNINIERMQVGQKGDNERNVIFLRTGSPISEQVLKALRKLPMVKDVTIFDLDE